MLIASPFLFKFGALDEGPKLRTLYETSTCPTFDVTYLPNALFTVEAARTMGRYGVVHLGTHGATYYFGLPSIWQLKFGWAMPGSQVVFLHRPEGDGRESFRKSGRPRSRPAGAHRWLLFVSAVVRHGLRGADAQQSGLHQRLPRHVQPDDEQCLPGSRRRSLPGLLRWSSTARFAHDRAMYFHEKFVEDPTDLVTTGDIFIPGQSHPFSPPAFWQLAGSTTLELPDGKRLQNGDFELGALGAWTATGDGRVVAQLGGIFDPDRGRPRRPDLDRTRIHHRGRHDRREHLPAGGFDDLDVRLELHVGRVPGVLRGQVPGHLSGPTRDRQRSGDSVQQEDRRSVRQYLPVPFSFDEGDAWSTGWQSVSLNISAIAASNAGKPVRLVFSAVDVGDSIFDTAVMLDRIEIKK